jgi:hypothetical protein
VELAAMAIAAIAVGAVAVQDWTPALILPGTSGSVLADDDDRPERLRLDLWDSVRSIRPGVGRNLFRYVEAPARATAAVKEATGGQTTQTDHLSFEESPPHKESFPLRFYGYAKRRTDTGRALFCDNELVYLVSESDVIGGRYRVVRIGILEAEVEDLTVHTRHTLALEDAVPS